MTGTSIRESPSVNRNGRFETAVSGALGVATGCAVGVTTLIGIALTPTLGILITVAVAVAVVLVILSIRNPDVASVILLALSFVCMRPMLFGERYSALSIALAIAGLACAGIAGIGPQDRSSSSVLVWVSLLWLWRLLLTLQPGVPVENTFRGLADVPLVMFAAWAITSAPSRRVLLVKLIVGMALATCASFIVTFLVWELKGFDAAQLGTIPAGYKLGGGGIELPGAPLYAPFTTTYGVVLIGTSAVPRLLGLGRESGIMGALVAWCYFMLPRIGWDRIRWKLLLLVGLAATQSTAAFGTFLFVFVLTKFIVGERPAPTHFTVLRTMAGVVGLAGAGYLAIYAPVLGIQFKNALNASSLNDRLQSTTAGLQSVLNYPLGQLGETPLQANAGINMISALAVTGAPGLFFSIAAFLRPFTLSQNRRAALGPVAVVLVTCLTAQPLVESTAFFLLVMLGCASYPEPQSSLAWDSRQSQPLRRAHVAD